jgi:putative transposon-encoded protein
LEEEKMETIKIFDGSEVVFTYVKEIHVYSDVCCLMDVDVLYSGGETDTIPMIFWQDGIIFCPKDWQSIPRDFTAETVDEINWINLHTGQDAIMYDGLPRESPFKPMGRPRKNPVLTDDQGNEYFEAVVAAQGTTGRLYPPAAWIGSRVRVTRID